MMINDSKEARVEALEVVRDDTDREIRQVEFLIQNVKDILTYPNSVASERVKTFVKELEKEKEYLNDVLDDENESIAFVRGTI